MAPGPELPTRMLDGYFHLDGSVTDPLADLEQRLASAGVGRALVVESWAGRERAALDALVTAPDRGEWKVAYCFRSQAEAELGELLACPRVRALRLRTADLSPVPAWLERVERSGRFLLCHGELGVGALAHAVEAAARRHPGLRIYIPHLGWPRREKQDDPDWRGCVARLAELPNVVFGISALAHFSRSGFPHEDLRPLAQEAIERFGPSRLVAATDYPNIDKARYAESYHLARRWITERWPLWSDDDVL